MLMYVTCPHNCPAFFHSDPVKDLLFNEIISQKIEFDILWYIFVIQSM